MSIYATLWRLKFPKPGDDYLGCEWVEVLAQGVPAHIGTPTPGYGYESGDPFRAFLPPPMPILSEEDEYKMRAVVIIRSDTPKVVQEYKGPLMVLTGSEYGALSFDELHGRISDALRGDKPRLVLEDWRGGPNARVRLVYEDGSSRDVDPKER